MYIIKNFFDPNKILKNKISTSIKSKLPAILSNFQVRTNDIKQHSKIKRLKLHEN